LKIEGRLAALDWELQQLRAMLDAVAPPVRPRLITTREEGHAVGKFLLANARGEAEAFERESLLPWALVQDVACRVNGKGQTSECPARYDAHQVAVSRSRHVAA